MTTQIATRLAISNQTVELIIPNIAPTPNHLSATQRPNIPNELRINRVGPRISGLAANTIGCCLLLFKGIRTALRSDVILSQHHYSWSLSFYSAVLALLTHRPLVIRSDDCIPGTYGEAESLPHKLLSFTVRACNLWAIRRARLFLVQSLELAEWSRRTFGLKKDAVSVSHNGVDTTQFSSQARSEQLRKQLDSNHIVAYSGTIIRMRALDDLLKATVILKSTIPDIKLIILGTGPDLPRIKSIAEALGLGSSVKFLGNVDHNLIPSYLASADTAIGLLRSSPQTYGANPVKILEYMASGVATIAAKSTAASDLLTNTNSIIIDPNAEDLVSAILKILSNPQDSAELTGSARETVETQYDWNRVVPDLLAHLNQVTRT